MFGVEESPAKIPSERNESRDLVLNAGTKLGSYEITATIGAGGMGEVYRAHDTNLGRDVAIKVLPETFARDAERMARFGREAKLLASLNHSNIASIYGFEDSGSTRALVMELAEGPTLADRIRQGPISIDEALPIARQIADALEYAHERGVVHRDLKPANIKISRDDSVKILDFGLAKAVQGEASESDMANSPTLSHMATQTGVLLGTAAYMSPEQAKGKPVDRRADIWAFGCVLYEMLTGKKTFGGDAVAETLASVLKNEPDWSLLPAATPMRVRVLLQRCLQKDAKQRLRDIGDARISLDEALSGAPEAAMPHAVAKPVWRRHLASAVACIAAAAVGAIAIWIWKPSSAPSTKPVTRFTITIPPDQQLAELPQPSLALSADGTHLAYVATHSAVRQIYIRAMDSTESKPVSGTEGATNPFFSPDGQWLGFFADGRLKKVSVTGGVGQTLADAVNPRGASWGKQGIIIFNNLGSGLLRVSDAGGTAESVDFPGTPKIPGEISTLWPEFLPDSKAVLFSSYTQPQGIVLQRIGTVGRQILIQGQPATMPRYLPSGHLVYVLAGSLMAAPFDLKRQQVVGAAVPVVQGVLESSIPPAPEYSVSDTGSLVYVSGNSAATYSRLVWVTRNGVEQPLAAPLREYDQPRLSPDGRRIAVNILESGNNQVWLYNLDRGTLERFTFEGSSNQWPVWTADGKRIIFQSAGNIFWQLADGSGGLERLTGPSGFAVPVSSAADGQLLAYIELNGGSATGNAVWVMRLSDHKRERFTSSQIFTDAPQFSPDGHWICYASEESGRREIYVQPYPGPGGKWQISTEGGTEPQWNRNGRELFYRDGDKMMAVDINTQGGFAAGNPRQLFEGRYLKNSSTYARPNYDVSLDGQRFLMLKPVEQEQTAPTQINVVLNWTEELKRLVPATRK
jgi:serine/threonine-protein kinase